jgi:alpha-beta hydrolase superfamily lysophospholipase
MSTTPDKISARDGTALMVRWWKRTGRPRGMILVVHGLGEHAGRYVKVAMHLTKQGFDCVTYDLRGHGKSEGRRGAIRQPDDHLDDLTLVIDAVRRAHPQNRLFLLGHSMGGQVAAQLVARRYRPVDGLILSSPALAVKTSFVQRLQLLVGSALFPGLAVHNGVQPDKVSKSAAVVAAYKADPLVHDRITPRLARAVLAGGGEVIAQARQWPVPTLLMWALEDHLVDPAGSAKFAMQAPQHVVRAKSFGGLYHEIFNAVDPAPVYATLDEWLEERAPS